MKFHKFGLEQKFWDKGPSKILTDKNDKRQAQSTQIGLRLLQTAQTPSNALRWLLLAPNEKTCATGPSARASCEIELDLLKNMNKQQQTAAPQTLAAPLSNRMLNLMFKA